MRNGVKDRHYDGNTCVVVYSEIIFTIATQYKCGIPDIMELTLSDLRFWYYGITSMLMELTKNSNEF